MIKKMLIVLVIILMISCVPSKEVADTPIKGDVHISKTPSVLMSGAVDTFTFAGKLSVDTITFEQLMGVHQFINWIMVCGTDLYIEDSMMNAEDTITATCEGKLIGAKQIIACPDLEQCTHNALTSMPIYLDDPWDEAVDCPEPGDTIDFQYNGIPVIPNPIVTWTAFGDNIPLVGFKYDTLCCLSRGDLNNDNIIDISDLVFLINYMFLEGPSPVCLMDADMNDDGGIDISDLMYLIDYMFKDGPYPKLCN